MTGMRTQETWAREAAAGDRAAAERLLESIRDELYRLALRMLGHPQDAEDATQEILLVVLTHLGSFRGESSFRTWSWRIASTYLLGARRGRFETLTHESVAALLDAGLRDEIPELPEPELRLLAREVRLRCTQAMLLGLDRDLRIAFVLGDIFALSGEEAAAVLELDPAIYRKRLSRARARLLAFLRARCGLFDAASPCRCRKQIAAAVERGQLRPTELLLAHHPAGATPPGLDQCAVEVDELLRLGEVLRHPDYLAPPGLVARIRALLDSGRLTLLEGEGR